MIEYKVMTAAEYRRQGIAKRLAEETMAAFEREGIAKVALLTFKKNTNANAFWDKCGFTLREDVNYRNRSIVEQKYRPNEFGNEEQYQNDPCKGE